MMRTLLALVILLCAGLATAKDPFVAPNAPKDTPTREDPATFDAAIAPYVAKARASYPSAKKRYLEGLQPKHSFFVTARLHDDAGNFELTFIAVDRIRDGKVFGRIWTDLKLFPDLKQGHAYSLPEAELIDWLITNPDGSEQGNFVGKFLDSRKRH
jgi:hypothetical protein